MLVSLDLVYCIADICLKRKRMEDVAKIYSPTEARTTEAFQEALVEYQQGPWQKWPQATDIALLFWNRHKIDRYKLRGLVDPIGTPDWVDESEDPHR